LPTNCIKLELTDELKCSVWDHNGTEHDISSIYEQLKGFSPSLSQEQLSLKHGQNSLHTTLKFAPTSRELTLSVAAAVVAQILEMKG